MALMKDGLWELSVVLKPPLMKQRLHERFAKHIARRDRALAIIVLSIELSLLYLIGDPKEPITVWQKLGDQF